MNADEFLKMDPYEEVAQQGQVHPLLPAYVPDPIELDEHVPVHVLEPEHLEYHAPSDDDIQVEDDDEDLEEDPERIYVRPQTPMAASTQALVDAFAAGSSPFPLPPISPAYDQAPLGHKAAMIRRRDDILKEDMPPRRRFAFTAPLPGCDIAESSAAAAARAPRRQYDFVNIVEAGHGLIRSPGHDARTIARAANRAEDTGYVRALQAFERRMMTSIEEVNLRVSYQAQVRRQERLKALLACLNGSKRWSQYSTLAVVPLTIKVKGNDVTAYTKRFQELALMCTKFFADETEKVDKYISGLPDNIHENIMSARPMTLDETIELANDLMDQKFHTYVERQNDNKRKTGDSSRNSQQQQPHKKQNVARAYTAGPGEKNVYTRDLPLCTK
nr:hypothetical protein [Tanacetum cinerariifolium]